MFNFKKVTHLPLISEEYNLLPKGLTKKENYTKRKVLNTFGLRKSGSTEGTLHLSDFEMITKSRFNKEKAHARRKKENDDLENAIIQGMM